MPTMMLCYLLQLLDKLALSYATQLGLIKDLVSVRKWETLKQ